jgi:hypothetical protein
VAAEHAIIAQSHALSNHLQILQLHAGLSTESYFNYGCPAIEKLKKKLSSINEFIGAILTLQLVSFSFFFTKEIRLRLLQRKIVFVEKIFLKKSFFLKMFSTKNILRCLPRARKINFFFFIF